MFWVGVALAPVALVVLGVMKKMGYGTSRHEAMDEPVTPPAPVATTATPAHRVAAHRRRDVDRMRGPLVTAGVVGGLTLALHFRDPHAAGSWGFCPWLRADRLYCPGCGGLRAVNDLTNGDVLGAASSNLRLRADGAGARALVAALDPARVVGRDRTARDAPARTPGLDRGLRRGDGRVRRAAQPAGRQLAGP